MAVRKVLHMGVPSLLRKAEPVERFNTPELDSLITDMFDTMAAYSGAGLAAPQIGISRRIIIYGVDHNPRYPDSETIPMTVLINPVIEPMTKSEDFAWEGCLSVPGMRGLVPRYTSIRCRGFNPSGEAVELTASGFHARVVQHECDHLDGILYPMRIRDLRDFGFEEVLFPDTPGEDT